ncbi:MAG: hypothetical protein GC191_16355 [Azospirillum sp.]|nr:hypothetical protein [Azospirillum sp.]
MFSDLRDDAEKSAADLEAQAERLLDQMRETEGDELNRLAMLVSAISMAADAIRPGGHHTTAGD